MKMQTLNNLLKDLKIALNKTKMTRLEHLLTILSEECMETGQRITKASRFTLGEIQAGHSQTNAQRINYEFNDILAVMEMIGADTGYDLAARDEMSIETKKINVEKFLRYSEEIGTLVDMEVLREKSDKWDNLTRKLDDLFEKLHGIDDIELQSKLFKLIKSELIHL
jgi:NTP pyrophosphatase (non-canonical NTP hydrolase)